MTKLTFRKEQKKGPAPAGLQEPKKHGLRKAIREHLGSHSDIGLKLRSLKRKVALSFTRSQSGPNDTRESWAFNSINKSERPIAAKTKAMLSRNERFRVSENNVGTTLRVAEETEQADNIGEGTDARARRDVPDQGETSGEASAPPLMKQQILPRAPEQASLQARRSPHGEQRSLDPQDDFVAGPSRQTVQTTSVEEHHGPGSDVGPITNSTIMAGLGSSDGSVSNATAPLPRLDESWGDDGTNLQPPSSSGRRAEHILAKPCREEESHDEIGSDSTAPKIGSEYDSFDDTVSTRHHQDTSHQSPYSPTKRPSVKDQSKLSKLRASFHTADTLSRLKAAFSSCDVTTKKTQTHRWGPWKSRPTFHQPFSDDNVSTNPCSVRPLDTPADQVHGRSWHSTVDLPLMSDLNTEDERRSENIYPLLSPVKSVSSLGLSFDNFEPEIEEVSKWGQPINVLNKQGNQADGTDLKDVMRRRSRKSTRSVQRENDHQDENVKDSDASLPRADSGPPPRTPRPLLTPSTLKMLQAFYLAASQNASFETNDDSGIEICDAREKDEDAIRMSKRRRRAAICGGFSLSVSSLSDKQGGRSLYSQKIDYHSTRNLARTRDWIGQQPEITKGPAIHRNSGASRQFDDPEYLFLFLRAFKECFRPSSNRDILNHASTRYETVHFRRILFPDRHRNLLGNRFQIESPAPLPTSAYNELYDHERTDQMVFRAIQSSQSDKTAKLVNQLNYSVWALDALRVLNNGTLIMSPVARTLKTRKQMIDDGHNIETFRVLDLGGAPVGDWGWAIAVEYDDFEVYTVTTHLQSGTPGIKGPRNHQCFTMPVLWRLPFEDSSFDLISARTLHIYLHNRGAMNGNYDEYDLVLQECLRVLKPGGYIEYILLDSDIRGLGPLGGALSKQFTELLKEKGYDHQPSSTFGDRLVKAGFNICGEAKIFLAMGPRFKTPFFGTDMPEDQFVELDEDEENPQQAMMLSSVTGLLGARMWESWLLKMQTEIGKPWQKRLDESVPILLDKRAKGPTGWNALMGWARKPTPGKVCWADGIESEQ
ncbi:hypothetical protein KEM56_007473 [Ascosphaera pollenicola]|nr:hypothetical protein KEM56_007473 [Ascosphaera pollenicola]